MNCITVSFQPPTLYHYTDGLSVHEKFTCTIFTHHISTSSPFGFPRTTILSVYLPCHASPHEPRRTVLARICPIQETSRCTQHLAGQQYLPFPHVTSPSHSTCINNHRRLAPRHVARREHLAKQTFGVAAFLLPLRNVTVKDCGIGCDRS